MLVGAFVYFLNIIKNKNEHTSVVLSTLNKKIKDKENINTLEKKFYEIGEIKKKVSSYIVDTAQIDTFVEYLESIGTNNNVNFVVGSVETSKLTKNSVNVKVSIIGSFEDVTRAVFILENSPYYITVNSSFINKDITLKTDDPMLQTKEIIKDTDSSWQADISFSVLTL